MSEDTATLLAAGRRAAYAELRVTVGDRPNAWQAVEPEGYAGLTDFAINGHSIGSVIDAAVMETVTRMTAAHIVLPEPLAKLRYLRPGVLPL